jgi:Protein  of unknown function (DUF3018)
MKIVMKGRPMPASQLRNRVAARRAKLRRLGLRPIEIWLPDTRAAGFAEEARRQSWLVDADRAEFDKAMDFIERNSAWPDDQDDIAEFDAPR